ncbi:hypothetical protein E8E13_000740 [Curvularia kusanoi]|uniref:Uncharacterized protein n=1 Tax=Curvularia kusanoi TaxID=90978 RepID=A0A9P4T3U8_CURKU|nr:hypothetical protein E8E13_000740 [Curvularia kusanoi]
MSASNWPDLSTYMEIASLYNIRDLTYPQDALPAISGVLNTLARSFPSGFVSGLPCMFLDIALDNVCHLIILQDKEGNPGGVLRRMNDDRAEAGDVIELVALSTGSVRSKDAWARNEMMRSGNEKTSEYHELKKEFETYGVNGENGLEYHFYNVMWIEREGGIAYRRAVGRVPKVIWEANCTGLTKIVLG